MDPIQTAAVLAGFAAVVKGLVDAARRQWPRLDGLAVQLVALALATLAAWALGFQATDALIVVPDIIDYLLTGTATAATAGLFAELSGRSGRSPLLVEVDSEGRPR